MVLDTILVRECCHEMYLYNTSTYREGGKGKIRPTSLCSFWALYLNPALPPFVISIVDPYLNCYYKVSSRKVPRSQPCMTIQRHFGRNSLMISLHLALALELYRWTLSTCTSSSSSLSVRRDIRLLNRTRCNPLTPILRLNGYFLRTP